MQRHVTLRLLAVLAALLVLALGAAAQEQNPLERGKQEFAKGNLSAAQAFFERAVKESPRSANAHYYLGEVLYRRGSLDSAAQELNASVNYDNEFAPAQARLGDIALAKKKPLDAVKQYRIAVKLDQKNFDYHAGLGDALLAADSTDAAIVEFTNARELQPNNPRPYMGLGDAYLKVNIAPLAITQYQKAVEVDSTNIPARIRLADTYLRQKQYNEALRTYWSVIVIDSTYAEAYHELGKIYMLAKDYGKSAGVLERYAELKPGFPAYRELAQALYSNHSYKLAIDAAKKALSYDAKSVEALRQLAGSFFMLGSAPGLPTAQAQENYNNAITSYQKLSALTKLTAEDYSNLGRAYSALKKDADAIATLQKALQQDSTLADVHSELARLLMLQKKWPDAISHLWKRIALDSTNIAAYINLGICYMQLSQEGTRKEPQLVRLDSARVVLLRAISLKPDFLLTRLYVARTYAMMDSSAAQKAAYEDVIKLASVNPEKNKADLAEAYTALASYYFLRKEYAAAGERYRQAIKIKPDDYRTHLGLGQCTLLTMDQTNEEEKARKTAEAQKEFRETTRLAPKEKEGYFWLAQAIMQSRVPGENQKNADKVQEARAAMRKVLQLDPKSPDAKKWFELWGK